VKFNLILAAIGIAAVAASSADAAVLPVSRATGADQLVASVPEPAAWALMIGGFALAGVALRRRPMAHLGS
jgi:hypothetical protein